MSTSPDSSPAPRSARSNLRVLDGGPAAATREPPHSQEAEEHLLACCLLDGGDVITRALRARISKQAFYSAANGIIWDQLCALHTAGKPVDLVVLAEELKTTGQLDAVGGFAYLAQVTARVPTTMQAPYFIEKVRELAVLRAAITAGHKLIEESYSFTGGLLTFVEEQANRLQRVADAVRASDEDQAERIEANLQKTLRASAGLADKSRQLKTGLPSYDKACFPLDPENDHFLILLAAENSLGKSSLLRQMQLGWARTGHPGLTFSLEMTSRVWVELMAATECGVSRSYAVRGELPRDQRERFDDEVQAITELTKPGGPMQVCDEPLTVEQIIARATDYLRRVGVLHYVAIDILSELNSSRAQQNRLKRMDEVPLMARELKAWAKRHGVPVILLAHFNRGPSSDQRRPRKSDLRDSGTLENAADVILYLHRPHKLPNGEEQDERTPTPIMEFGALKNRTDSSLWDYIVFDKARTRFRDLTPAERDAITSGGGGQHQPRPVGPKPAPLSRAEILRQRG